MPTQLLFIVSWSSYDNHYIYDFGDKDEALDLIKEQITQTGRGLSSIELSKYELPEGVQYRTESVRYSTDKLNNPKKGYYADETRLSFYRVELDEEGDETEVQVELDPVDTQTFLRFDIIEYVLMDEDETRFIAAFEVADGVNVLTSLPKGMKWVRVDNIPDYLDSEDADFTAYNDDECTGDTYATYDQAKNDLFSFIF